MTNTTFPTLIIKINDTEYQATPLSAKILRQLLGLGYQGEHANSPELPAVQTIHPQTLLGKIIKARHKINVYNKIHQLITQEYPNLIKNINDFIIQDIQDYLKNLETTLKTPPRPHNDAQITT